ncbi:tachykinin-like peptides receptor 86C [Tachypleus tridentatus]|uniref:tachykinin-like peptides receptor 86C n=1 Tax=Tachypleus tridentatus TaxID=6853 RepID=UPI003FD657B3
MKFNATQLLNILENLYGNFSYKSDFEDKVDSAFEYNFTRNQLMVLKNIFDCMESWNKEVNGTGENITTRDGIELLSLCSENFSSLEPATRPFVLLWWQQMLWGIVFGLMIVIALIGNAISVWVVLAHRGMRTVTNYFILNLSSADFTMTLFNTTFNFVFMLDSHWPFGRTYCLINNFVANLTVSSSVFTIMAMSLERYVVTLHPLLPRMTKKTAIFAIVMVWLSSALLSLPTLLYSTTVSYTYQDGTFRTLCLLIWPDGPTGNSDSDYIYNIAFFILTYVLPIGSMAVAYISMSRVLWRQSVDGVTNQIQPEAVKSKRRVVRMLTAIVVIFGVCWLPYHIYFLYTYHDKELVKAKFVQHLYLAIYWLAMANAMFNPLIYFWTNQRFRRNVEIILCRCCDKHSIPQSPLPPRRQLEPRREVMRLNNLIPNNGYMLAVKRNSSA